MTDVRAEAEQALEDWNCLCMFAYASNRILGSRIVSGVKEGRIKKNSKVMIADDLEYSGMI